MQKVDGVQGVRVSLKDGLTILDLKPDNRVTLAQLRQIIKNNGFVSKEAQVTARGASSSAEGKPIFEVSGTRERFLPSASPQQSGDDWVFSVSAPSR
jgi:hypothetical protein